jgi:hypothetical protein
MVSFGSAVGDQRTFGSGEINSFKKFAIAPE